VLRLLNILIILILKPQIKQLKSQQSRSYHNGFSPTQGIPRLYRNVTSLAAFTRPCLCVLSRATSIQSTSPYDVFTIHFNIIPHTRLCLIRCLFPSHFLPFKIPYFFAGHAFYMCRPYHPTWFRNLSKLCFFNLLNSYLLLLCLLNKLW
jgi:hypothetical protein